MTKELYDMRTRFISILSIVIVLFFVVAPFQNLTTSMLEGYSDNPALEKLMPKGFAERLKEWNFYINSQWFGKNFGQMIPIIGIIIAFPLFAREFENGTIEYLLVRRSRRVVFVDKFLSGFLATVILIFIASSLPPLYSLLSAKDYDFSFYFKATVQSEIAGILWYCIGMLFSTIFNDQVKPVLASLGAIALTTAAGLIKALKFLNTYSYALCSNLLENGPIDVPYTIGIILVSSVLISISYMIFRNKDA